MSNNLLNITNVYKGEIAFNYDIKKLMSWKIGGLVECITFPRNEDEILILMEYAKDNCIPYYVIGRGSNILFGDMFFHGLVIYLGKNYINYTIEESNDGYRLVCSSGLSLGKLGKIAKENSLTGCEYLGCIPGTIGGAILTNAEAHKQSIGDIVTKVKVIENGEILEYFKEMCGFKYRSSIFENKSNIIILSVELQLTKGLMNEILSRIGEAKAFRLSKQPKDPNAGSIFKNPTIGPAGKLIQDAGLKGLESGDAKVSELHGNFIVNRKNATSDDIISLIETVKETIKNKYGVELELEIKLFNL